MHRKKPALNCGKTAEQTDSFANMAGGGVSPFRPYVASTWCNMHYAEGTIGVFCYTFIINLPASDLKHDINVK